MASYLAIPPRNPRNRRRHGMVCLGFYGAHPTDYLAPQTGDAAVGRWLARSPSEAAGKMIAGRGRYSN
jgi:hypothetical protein